MLGVVVSPVPLAVFVVSASAMLLAVSSFVALSF